MPGNQDKQPVSSRPWLWWEGVKAHRLRQCQTMGSGLQSKSTTEGEAERGRRSPGFLDEGFKVFGLAARAGRRTAALAEAVSAERVIALDIRSTPAPQ